MTAEGPERKPPADRESPVGQPVVRGDPQITGQRPEEAVRFNPDEPGSLSQAAETVRAFADNTAGDEDNVFMLRGAAACAALVRGEGSYKAAAERAGADATVAFIRKWSRVHDLPQSIRRHVARGEIAPTAAKHIARVSGEARFLIAWAALDHGMTVREVRSVASRVNDGESVKAALSNVGYSLGQLDVRLSAGTYLELRRHASLTDTDPSSIIDEALASYLESDGRQP